MAKAVKKKAVKKVGKYDITVKTDMSFDELIKLAATTPKPKNSKKK